MSQRKALRVAPIPISQAKIDRQAMLIRDTVAMQIGEARGHGMWADAKTLHMMAALGNSASFGIKGRMGHPGMSDNAFAKEVMRAKNFRVVGDKLLHDVSFYEFAKKSPAYSQDPVNYIFDRAEQNPESFGESVVVWVEEYWVRADGSEVLGTAERPEDAIYEFPSMRPKEFYYVDFVTDGALTPNGLFSAEGDFWRELFQGTSSEHTEKAFLLLSDVQTQFHLSDEDLALKVPALLNQYAYWKGFQVDNQDEKAPVGAAANPLDTALAEANSIFAELETKPETTAPVPAPVGDMVSRAEFEASQAALAQAQSDLASLQDAHQKLQLSMGTYVGRMNEAFKLLSQKVAALASEPIESSSVPRIGTLSANAPVPNAAFMTAPMPTAFDQKAQEAVATGQAMDLVAIAKIEDPVARKQAIDRFNKQSGDAFGFRN